MTHPRERTSPQRAVSAPGEHPDDAAPWLTPEELTTWLVLIRLAGHLPAALDRRLQRVAGLTHFEYVVLSRLSESSQRCQRMSDLAEITHSSNARLSHVAGRLQARGLIERRPATDDRRAVDAVLTDAGHAALLAAAPDHVRHVRALVVDALEPAELDQLRRIGEKLLARLDQDRAGRLL
jgi:DNA-binding MarR family transcriptional regulator